MKGMFSHSLALNLGRTLGPLFILLGHEHIHYILILIAVWSLLLVTLPEKQSPHLTPEGTPLKLRAELTGLILIPFIVTILFTTYTGILHSSLGHTLKGVFNLTGLEASQLMAKVLLLGSALMALTQVSGKILLRNHFRLGLLLGLGSLTTGAVLLAFMDREAQLWISISLISIGIALVQPSHLALIHELFPKKAIGRKIGLLATGNTIGYAIGGAITSLFLKIEINKIALIVVGLLIIMTFINCLRVSHVKN
jgi:MFS family permease